MKKYKSLDIFGLNAKKNRTTYVGNSMWGTDFEMFQLRTANDKSDLVTDSNADIMVALGDKDLDVGEGPGTPVRLHRRSHRVLEELEEDVVEVGRGVAERKTNLLTLCVHHLHLS